MTEPNETSSAKWYQTRKDRTLRVVVGGVVVGGVLAAGAVFAAQAVADSRPAQHIGLLVAEGGIPDITPAQFSPGHGFGPGFGPGGPRSPLADMTDEEIDSLVSRMVAHAAIELDATDEQRDAITAIVLSVAREIRTVPDGFRDAGEQMQSLLLADEIDAEALEAIRAERLAEVDRVSREIFAAITQVAGLLTAEQRRLAADRLETFREMRERRRSE